MNLTISITLCLYGPHFNNSQTRHTWRQSELVHHEHSHCSGRHVFPLILPLFLLAPVLCGRVSNHCPLPWRLRILPSFLLRFVGSRYCMLESWLGLVLLLVRIFVAIQDNSLLLWVPAAAGSLRVLHCVHALGDLAPNFAHTTMYTAYDVYYVLCPTVSYVYCAPPLC